MNNRWPARTLGELVANGELSYGIVQPGNHVLHSGVPIVRVKDLQQGRVDTRDPLRVDPSVSGRHQRTILRGGEVLVSIVGTVGQSAIVPSSMAGWNVARAIAVIRPRDVSAKWIELCLQSPETQAALSSRLNTTVQATLNLSDLKAITIPLPPALERDAIAKVMSALDDKIDTNERIITLLDDWVRSSFAALTGQSRPLGDFATNIRSQVQPSDVEPSTPYYGLEHIPRRSMWASAAGTASGVTSVKSVFNKGDILFGKLRPYFHKVVSVASDGVCSTDILVIRSVDPGLAGFTLAAFASDATVRACTAASEGTRMPRVSWRDLRVIPVPWPGDSTARRFSVQVLMKSRLAHGLICELRQLRALRGELLPLLMSGKIRVRDAETAVEGLCDVGAAGVQ